MIFKRMTAYDKELLDEKEKLRNIDYWTDYLKTASMQYKHSFDVQVSIHGSAPAATACAEAEFWNGKDCTIDPDAKPIFTRINGKTHRLFDISDVSGQFKISYWIWSMQDNMFGVDFTESVNRTLNDKYSIKSDALEETIYELTIRKTAEKLGADNALCDVVSESAAFMAIERCCPDSVEMSTESLVALATADIDAIGKNVTAIAREVLNEIEGIVKAERIKIINRSMEVDYEKENISQSENSRGSNVGMGRTDTAVPQDQRLPEDDNRGRTEELPPESTSVETGRDTLLENRSPMANRATYETSGSGKTRFFVVPNIENVIKNNEFQKETAANDDKEKPMSKIIGNTEYKYIPQKTYKKYDNDKAKKIIPLLDKSGLKYSGKVTDTTTTFTISRNGIPLFEQLAAEAEKMADTEKPIVSEVNKLFKNPDTRSVSLEYYNPEGNNGEGQYVQVQVYDTDIQSAIEYSESDPDAFMEYIYTNCHTELIDRGADDFESFEEHFINDEPDFMTSENSDNTDMYNYFVSYLNELQKDKPEVEKEVTEAKEPTEEEILFEKADLAMFLAERTMSSDEWEDMAYPLFENGYLDKHKPSDRAILGYHLGEPVLYDLARRYHEGEDIRKELALGLLEHTGREDIEFVFEDGKISDRTFYYPDDRRLSLHTEMTDNGFNCSFNGMERFVSFEDIGKAFIDRTYEEFDDISYWWICDEIKEQGINLTDDTIRLLVDEFDSAKLHGWDTENNTIKINRIKKALDEILGDYDLTEKVFAIIAKEKYHVTFEEKLMTLQDVVDKYFGTDCESAESADGTWKLSVAEGEKVGELFHNGVAVCGIYNNGDKMSIEPYEENTSFPKMLADAMIQHNPDKPVEIKEYERKFETPLDEAKYYIDLFCEHEYGEGEKGDYDDLHSVPIAYTTLTDDELSVQVTADLADFKMTYEFDGEVYDVEQYDSLESMIEKCLKWMGFDELVSVPDDIIEKHIKAEEQSKTKYQIYQLPMGDKYHGIRFESLETLKKSGIHLNHSDYEFVYEGTLDEFNGTATLESLFTKFNTDHPADFKGHSLSMSDVIVVKIGDEKTAYYCDDIGFTEMPDFFKEKEIITEKPAPEVTVDEIPTPEPFAIGESESVKSFDDMQGSLFDTVDNPVENEETSDTTEPNSISVGDKFKRKTDSAEVEVVSLSGALPWYQDDVTIKRMSGAFEITENISTDRLLDKSLYERVSDIPQVQSINLRKVDNTFDIYGDEALVASDILGLQLTVNDGFEKVSFSADMKSEYSDKLRDAGYTVLIEEAYQILPPDKNIAENRKYLHDEVLRGSGFQHGKQTIQEFYLSNQPTNKEFADFLKKHYGIGGHTCKGDMWLVDHDPKGFVMHFRSGEKLTFSWLDAAKEISALIIDGEYLPVEAEKEPVSEQIEETAPPETVVDGTPKEEPVTYNISIDEYDLGGAKSKFKANVEAIRTLKQLISEGRKYATPEEQAVMAKYTGWGGLANAFDDTRSEWSDEYTELKNLLTEEEYISARSTVTDAFYTPPYIIHSVYKALENMGFMSGKILDPSTGIGNFIGCMPVEMKNRSSITAAEVDKISGRIAQYLYPLTNVEITGFEKKSLADNSFDVVVSNIPFGSYKINDRRYNKHNFAIHDYFFAKSLDKVRAGGIIVFITSTSTMDKQNSSVRKYISDRAELLGAIRLPNTAFKSYAGTEVTSDIIFLKKRERMIDIAEDWVYTGEYQIGDEKYPMNNYFLDNPDMILGNVVLNKLYGRGASVEPYENSDLKELLDKAVSKIKGKYVERTAEIAEEEEIKNAIPAEEWVRDFSYALIDDKIYYRQGNLMLLQELSGKRKERMLGMIFISSCVHELLDMQLQGYPEMSLSAKRQELNELYEDFTKKHGLLNSRENSIAFREDSSAPLLLSLENVKDGKLISKADIFTKTTLKPPEKVTSVANAHDALIVSISEKARVDLDFMSGLLSGMDKEQIVKDLKGDIYYSPEDEEYQTADEYLSGNIRNKIKTARAHLAKNPDMADNITALEAVMPEQLQAADIVVKLGASWVDTEYIEQFIAEKFEIPVTNRDDVKVEHNKFTANWNVNNKAYLATVSYVVCNEKYGTNRKNALEILEASLNQRDITVYDTVYNSEKGKDERVINHDDTLVARQKQEAIERDFSDWIFADAERRTALVEKYNVLFNSTRNRQYDGSHLNFEGMNTTITLKPHQRDAVAHALYGGNTLFAHKVGAGKSYEMMAAAMEGKRLGLHNKSLIAVPNHMTLQFANEFLELYPNANILVASDKDFAKDNRRRLCAKIATGEFDAIIIGHSQLIKIPISKKREQQYLKDQINEIVSYIDKEKMKDGKSFTVKDMERTRKRLEEKLNKLIDSPVRDNTVTFEELGVDKLIIDEADMFKNMPIITKMHNVSGITTNSDVQKTQDLFLKCQYLNEITGGTGLIFATGTPSATPYLLTETTQIRRFLNAEFHIDTIFITHIDRIDHRNRNSVFLLHR